MATGLSSQEKAANRVQSAPSVQFDADKKIAVFLITVTLSLLAFLVYGGRDDTAKIIKEATPVHVMHSDYYQSGNL